MLTGKKHPSPKLSTNNFVFLGNYRILETNYVTTTEWTI